MFVKHRNSQGFTLIELLIVIAIIGVLSSVVLASLNTARGKGQIASIKSNLKNMIAEAELLYDATSNYSTACASVQKMIDAINASGGTASCYSHNASGDVYTRWGASARLNSDPTKNYTVNENGVATFDTADISVSSMSWDAANTACAASGGRLPTIEQLRSLWVAYGSTSPINPNTGFRALHYWSSTTVPSTPANAYRLGMATGVVVNYDKTSSAYVHCIR